MKLDPGDPGFATARAALAPPEPSEPVPAEPPAPQSRAWPGLCTLCAQAAQAWLCEECEARHGRWRPRCQRCGLGTALPLAECGECIAQPPPFVASVCAVDYVFPWTQCVLALKSGAGLDAASGMAARSAAAAATASAAGLLPGWPDAFVPVPLSRERLRQRGHNQAAVLARALARQLRRPCWPQALWRVADTAPQAGLSRRQRLTNLHAAFAPAPGDALAGRCVALVDDVVTTTATTRAAAAALLRGGAAQVQIWAFARTPAPHDE